MSAPDEHLTGNKCAVMATAFAVKVSSQKLRTLWLQMLYTQADLVSKNFSWLELN